jgi:hypothetical protein
LEAVFFVEFAVVAHEQELAIGIVSSHFSSHDGESRAWGYTYVLPSKDDGSGLEDDMVEGTYRLCADLRVWGCEDRGEVIGL